METFEQHEQPRISSLAEVSAIEKSRNEMILTREQLKDFVEQPLLNACEDMWNKNIMTLSSSANKKDIEAGEAYIIVDFDNLSEENKGVAQQYVDPIDYDGMKAVKILIPVSEKTTPDKISQQALKIANTFQWQKATWVPQVTLQDTLAYYEKLYGDKYPDEFKKEEKRLNQPGEWEKYCEESGYYFDPKTQVAYRSQEHYQKANEEKQ